MRSLSAILTGALIVVAAGCNSVRHDYQPYQVAGTATPVEVSVPHKADEHVSGTVFHRAPGAASYTSMPMRTRGDQLWAMLPTEQFEPEETIEYYIDVDKAGNLHALGSPGAPYVVTFLDRTHMILTNLSDKPFATDADHAVRIVLVAGNQPIEQASALYQMPGVPGEVRAPMESDGQGNYQVIIPPRVVRAGTWKYAIEVPIDGETYRMPQQGFRSFVVARPYRPAVAVGD